MRPLRSVIALIPARSGSKRLPHKNIHPLGGHPLMAYSIAAAAQSGIFSKVIVSTDSGRYAEIARHYGAEAPFLRPVALAGERSMDVEWVEDALSRLDEKGERYDCFAILRPTSPFRLAATIRRAWDEFLSEDGVDSIRAVEKCRQHPGKMWTVKGKRMSSLLPQDPAAPLHSLQYASLPEVYVQNASLEIAHARVVTEDRSIAGRTVMPFFTQGFEGFDINEPADLWHAEYLVQQGEARLPGIACAPFRSEIPAC